MARSIAEIQQEIIDAKNAEADLADLTSTSKVAIWRLWTYVVAVVIWTLENLFDAHKAEVEDLIANTRPFYVRDYVARAKLFQYGFELVPDGIYYDNTGIDGSVVEASRVVKYAAANGALKGLRIKIAGADGSGILQPITNDQFTAFQAYMNRIKAPGLALQFKNQQPDQLKLDLLVYYDPLVLSPTGARLDGTADTPVKDAINAFLRNQPFDGLLVLLYLANAVAAVDGVVFPNVNSAQAQYAAVDWLPITVSYQPDAGYLNLQDVNLTVTYMPHEPL